MPSNTKLEIKISSEDELVDKFTKSIHILNNLRYWSVKHRAYPGHENKKSMDKWGAMADDFLTELKISKSPTQSNIKIIKTEQ